MRLSPRVRPMLLVWLLLLLGSGGCQSLPALPLPSMPSWAWPFQDRNQPASPLAAPVITFLDRTGTESENRVRQQAIQSFEQAHPAFRIDGALAPDFADRLAQAVAADDLPDVFPLSAHQLHEYVAGDRLLPISRPDAVLENVPPNIQPGLEVNGVPYCYPRDLSTLALFYNPALFDRVEAAYPTGSWDWQSLRAAADATTDATVGIYGLVLTADVSRLHAFLVQADSDGAVWQGADRRTAVEYIRDMFTAGDAGSAVTPEAVGATWHGEAFGRGQMAMTVGGSWLIGYLDREFPELEYDVVELPSGPTGQGTTAFISCWVVSRTAPDTAAASELAAFLSNSETTQAWATAASVLPPRTSDATIWVGDHPAYNPFVNAIAYATAWSLPPDYSAALTEANVTLDALLAEEADVQELLDALQRLDVAAADTLVPPSASPTPAATQIN